MATCRVLNWPGSLPTPPHSKQFAFGGEDCSGDAGVGDDDAGRAGKKPAPPAAGTGPARCERSPLLENRPAPVELITGHLAVFGQIVFPRVERDAGRVNHFARSAPYWRTCSAAARPASSAGCGFCACRQHQRRGVGSVRQESGGRRAVAHLRHFQEQIGSPLFVKSWTTRPVRSRWPVSPANSTSDPARERELPRQRSARPDDGRQAAVLLSIAEE